MTLFRRIACFFVFALLASPAFAGFTRVNAPNPDDPMDVHIYRLDNGLMVYLSENREEPRFYAEIAVRAGSKHDPSESTGLAHYLEHMLFKGTQTIGTIDYAKEKPHLDRITRLYEDHHREKDPDKRKAIYAEINRESQMAARYAIPNELDKVYKAMGESGLNAHTWHEETVYKVGLPSNRLKHWALIESQRFQNPVFRLFQPELEVVYEEKNRTLDNKDWLVREAVRRLMYQKHPYGQQTAIGEVEHLKNPSLKNMYAFYDTYYAPNNMAICISGDIDIDAAIQLIDRHFSAWKPKNLPDHKSWKEPTLKGVVRDTVRFRGEEYALIGFRTAHRNHKDAEALKLIDMILDNRTAGLINLNLVQGQQVRSAGSYPALKNDYGAQYLWGIPKSDQTLAEVEQLLRDQIEIIKSGAFDASILPAIITDFKKHHKRGLESNNSRVARLRQAFLSHSDWDAEVAEIARMEKLAKRDIVRVANQYFGKAYAAVHRIDEQHDLPKIEKPQIDKIDIDPTRQSAFAGNILSQPVREIEPRFLTGTDYRIAELADGIRLYYAKNPINDLFSFSIAVDVGARQDNRLEPAKWLMERSGVDTLSAEALRREWYRLGTDFDIDLQENETAFRISGLDENFGASLSLMLAHLARPNADQATLDERVKIALAQREDEKKNPRAVRDALREYSRYGEASGQRQRLSTQALKALTVEDLHGLVRDLIAHKYTLIYVGSQPIEDVIAAMTQRDLAPRKDPPPYDHRMVRAPEQTEIRFFHQETAQSQVFIEFGGASFNEALRPAIDLYNDYFAGGMSGIVFQELREARALAYSAFARYDPGDRVGDPNRMWGYIGCQADKTPEAIEAFIDLIDNLPQTPERFDAARASVINRYRVAKIGFRDVPEVLRIWERQGLTPDPRQTRFEHIQQAGFPVMLNFHKAHIQNRAKLVSIVGDTTRFDLNRLSKVGKVMPVSLEDLFRD